MFLQTHVVCGDCGKLRLVHSHAVNMPLCLALDRQIDCVIMASKNNRQNKKVANGQRAIRAIQKAEVKKLVKRTKEEESKNEEIAEELHEQYPTCNELMEIENSQHAVALLVELRLEVQKLFHSVLALPDVKELSVFTTQFATFATAMVTQIAGPMAGVVMDEVNKKSFKQLLERILASVADFVTTICIERIAGVNVTDVLNTLHEVIEAMNVGNPEYKGSVRGPIMILLEESFANTKKRYSDVLTQLLMLCKACKVIN